MPDVSCDSFAVVVTAGTQPRLNDLQVHLRSWLALWGVPRLNECLTIEWSSRLQRSLGRAIPDRCLIRLSPILLTDRRDMMLEVVCHEVAHVVVPLLYRGPRRPHGPEWAQLVRAAGFPSRSRAPIAANPRTRTCQTSVARYPGSRLYVHICPICHIRRVARRRVPRWRCAACVDAGLEGRLTVVVMEVQSP
jgi:predicted SprT family Zn-dependent metalloprotease